MDRRESLTYLLSGITFPFCSSNTEQKGQFLLVVYLNVGSLPPLKAEAFVERVKDKLSHPSNFHLLFVPRRNDCETWIDVFSLDGVRIPEKLCESWFLQILEEGKIKKIESEEFTLENTDQDIHDYCMIMFGAPTICLPSEFAENTQRIIELGRRYNICQDDLKSFVFDSLKVAYSDMNWICKND